MPDITVSDITTSFPEFANTDPALIQIAINDAKLFVNKKVWGPKYLVGWKYFTAHLLASTPTSGGGGGGGGPIQSEKVGDLSVTYGSLSVSTQDHSTTAYGRIFDQLMRTLLKTMIFNTGC